MSELVVLAQTREIGLPVYCRSCGSRMEEYWRYCRFCGVVQYSTPKNVLVPPVSAPIQRTVGSTLGRSGSFGMLPITNLKKTYDLIQKSLEESTGLVEVTKECVGRG